MSAVVLDVVLTIIATSWGCGTVQRRGSDKPCYADAEGEESRQKRLDSSASADRSDIPQASTTAECFVQT